MTSIGASRPGVIGRDDDLAAGDRFLDALDGGSAMLVLEGEPGIGKTTIWSEIRARALARGHTVLTSQPVQSETELPFAGLLDLLGEHLDLLVELPGPQRRALEIALDARRTGAQRDSRQSCRLSRLPFVARPDVERNRRSSSRSTICNGSTCRRFGWSRSRFGGSDRCAPVSSPPSAFLPPSTPQSE